MKGFKKEIDIYLTIENVLWIFLILLPFLLRDSVIKESVQFHYFDYFKPIPFLILIGVIIILWYIKSNLKTKMFIFKWFFPVCLWINLYMPKEGNGTFVIISIDILYCVLILWATFGVLKPDSYNPELNQGLISDDPIEPDEENDSFGRKDYAKSIVSEIRKTVNKRAFNIAVTGAWGSGKTSFLNLIKGEMDKDIDDDKEEHHEKVKFITVKYNPWDFKEDKIIGHDLLKTISHELANEKELQEKFKGLLVSLQGLNKDPWYKVIPYFLSGFHKEKSINEYRKEIGDTLAKQKKKLVIFLDDLDRLDGDEILEVFKTIRNSFDIANTFFILGFDIDYVIDQIKEKVKGERALEYLDKIFQMRLFMPSISGYSYYQEFKILVKAQFNFDLTADIDWTFQIYNNRNLFHLINSLKVFFNNQNHEDYNFKALVQIESLKIINPRFYNYIIENLDSVLNKYNSIGSVNIYTDGRGSDENSYQNIISEFSEKSKDNSITLLESFFKKLDINQEYKIKKEEFLKYFKYSLQKGEFSTAILKEAISSQNKVLILDSITENNKDSLIVKIDRILDRNQNDWLQILLIDMLYKDRKYFWLYSKKYNINDYNSYLNIEDLKSKIANLHLKDKIIFLTDLENKNDEVTHYLIDLFSDYFERKIDDLFWIVYHSLNDAKHQLTNSPISKYFNIINSTITENYIDVIKVAISLFKDEKGGTRFNHSDPANYYLIGLFSAQEWLSIFPEYKDDESPYSDIKNWLENLDSNNCGLLDFTKIFGKSYFGRSATFEESKLDKE